MTAKIEFFYTHGHSYTATNVDDESIFTDGAVVRYSNVTTKENLDIRTVGHTEVKMDDLKFAIVYYGADSDYAGSTTIIHGLVEKFDVLATFTEADKIRKIEAADRELEERIAYKRVREAAKYEQRRAKRSAQRKAEREAEEQQLVKMAKAAQSASK